MPTVDRDCVDLLKDVPPAIRKQIQEAEDPKRLVKEMKAEVERKKGLVEKAQAAQVRLFNLIENHPGGPTVGIRSILANDLTAKASNSNIEYRQRALQGIVEGKILTLKKHLSTTKLGYSRDTGLADDFVRAIFGDENASALAKKMAKEWEDASEFMRLRFNEYGGNIGKLDYGYIKQSHNMDKIRATNKDEWVNYIRPLLRDDVADEIDLNYVYETIATGGLNKLKEGTASFGNGKSIANKNADERVLHFRDADSWMKYQKEFGEEDVMSVIDDNIRQMTQDMSLIEIMGPNPMHMYETLKVKRDMLRGAGNKDGFDSYTDAIWEVVSGRVDQDMEGINWLGKAAQYGRAMNTATMLGGATLSAVSDLGTLMVNTVYNGMSPFKVLKSMIKNFNIKNHDDAIRVGLGAGAFNSTITRRFTELSGQNFWSKVSEALMRATMMNIWTEAGRKAFQVEYMHKLLKGKSVEDLSTDELILMLEKVHQEADYAVLTPTARTRAITTGGKAKGTMMGELARTGTQFQSFTLVFMQQVGSRMFLQGSVASRVGYTTGALTMATLLGSVGMMAKDTSKGWTRREGLEFWDEDVELEDSVKFWSAAALQGGGAGFFGDLLFSDQTRYGNSPVPSLLGPTAGVIEDTIRLTIGNAQQAIKDEDTHLGSETVDFINRHLNPTNAFYIRLATEELIMRNLKILLDPDYERTERRKERKRRKEYGQEKFEWLQDVRESPDAVYDAQEGLQDILDSI